MPALTRHGLRRRLAWLTALTCAAAVVASLSITAVVVSLTSTAASAAVDAQPRSISTSRHPAHVMLPTGERIALQWSGNTPRIVHLPGDPSLSVAVVGSDVYAIPVEAVPYLGSAFDRSLFDVTALAAKEGPDGAEAMPVSLTYAGPAVGVPGVRITSQSGSHASGYLDSPTTFGAAVKARLRSDPGGARQVGTPVAGLTHFALDGPAAATVQPDFAQVTLTVRLVPPADGRMIQGALVLIANTDDTRKYDNFVAIGPENVAKVSVPKGHYGIVGDVFAAAADGTDGRDYVPTVVDYAATTNDQSVTLDAGSATAFGSFSTPRPADLVLGQLDIAPTDGQRPAPAAVSFFYSGEHDVLVQPTPNSKHGVLEFDVAEHRSATAAGKAPFDYHLTAEWLTGIPADLHRSVTADQLARVEDHVYAGGASGGRFFGRGPVYPDLRGGLDGNVVSSTGTLIDYVYGPPDVQWLAQLGQSSTDADTGSESMQTQPVPYSPGRTYRVDWFRESLAPGFTSTLTFPQRFCVACRTPDGMSVSISSELDADPNHTGTVSGGSGYERFQVFQDGVSIADVADSDGASFPVPPEEHTYRIEDTVDRAALGFTTATQTSSVYTVRSSATSGAPVPASWQCLAAGTGACTVLPLLSANVALPTTPAGTLSVGRSSFVVRIGHVAAAARSAISTLTFATSLDGTTFSPATVTALGNGRYRVSLTNPAGAVGHPVSIRLHAEDAAGATLTQTVVNAYTVTGG